MSGAWDLVLSDISQANSIQQGKDYVKHPASLHMLNIFSLIISFNQNTTELINLRD